MHKWRSAAVALAVVLLFLVANRGAYKGFFSGDDLDNLAWTPRASAAIFAKGLISPLFSKNNFRPTGHLYFHILGKTAFLKFPPYIATLQCIHLLNGLLLFLILRRLKFSGLPALAAVAFFLFHVATFDAYWQPMYIFDVLCATFCLAAFLCYLDERWVWSIISFWLAYKAKEVAVMFPLVLLAYESLLGQKRWKPLVPFFAISASFGIQAMLFSPHKNDDYTLRFTPAAVWDTLRFYLPVLFGVSIAGLAVLAGILFVRDRRGYFGLLAAACLLIPMLFLPGREFQVYLYVPAIGAAIAIAALTNYRPAILVPVFLLLWVPYTYGQMRGYRKATLAAADDRHDWVNALIPYMKEHPDTEAFLYDGAPASIHDYGVLGTIHTLSPIEFLKIGWMGGKDVDKLLRENNLAVLSWDSVHRKLFVTRRDPNEPVLSYVKIGPGMPIWQFKEGWYPRENYYRWTSDSAEADLLRPAGAKTFELYVNMSPVALQELHAVTVSVEADGTAIGSHTFTAPGWQSARWPVPQGDSKVVNLRIRTSPIYHANNDPRDLGVAVGGFGYLQ